MIIIALIAVEVIIVGRSPVDASHVDLAQVLIREGPELGHKLAHPIIQYFHSIIDPESAAQTAREVIREEMPKFREGVERSPHPGMLPLPAQSESDTRRLV